MSLERIAVKIYQDNVKACRAVAQRIAQIIQNRRSAGKKAVLGLATGHTPVNVYRELIRLHREEKLDFSNVITFNLDEYWPINSAAMQSYHLWMWENLFNHINVPEQNIHIPPGDVAEADIPAACQRYEELIEQAGGIDLQILGIGRSGHIGFNEPGSGRGSRTRRIHLDTITRKDAAADFFGEENVPEMAITMGVGSILSAREICLLAFGEHKAPVIRRAVEGEVSPQVAASFLQEHSSAAIYLDEAAAAELTRMKTPWLLGSCRWDEILQRKAVIWLADKVKKPILKLTDEDYGENGLEELRRLGGGAYNINLAVFRSMMKTITGWPGGKDGAKQVLIFSPHPDDDVISMGGTIMRLREQGHEVHVAYMVSGSLSVFDHDVQRYADFVREFNTIFGLTPEQSSRIEQHIDKFLLHKKPGEIDSPEVQSIKGLIRKTEALDAARFCGLPEERVHFLELPFYRTGKVQKLNVAQEDIRIVRELMEQLRPEMVFAAGDMSDPHGTHRQCLEAFLTALGQYNGANPPPEVWLYRGAWQEWAADEIEMAVPMSPDELRRKRYGIFRHQSQKDRAMFPGPYDSREFWQRAEERNMATAETYDALGLPEYHAVEAFVRYPRQMAEQLKSQLIG